MSYQKDRDEFLAIMASEGMEYSTALKMLRYAATLNRLAEAVCNGDYPADNGERETRECQKCQGLWAPRGMYREPYMAEPGGRVFYRYVCPDCRTEDLVRKALPKGFRAVFQGDPRGCMFKVVVPSGKTNDWAKEGVCVPVRE